MSYCENKHSKRFSCNTSFQTMPGSKVSNVKRRLRFNNLFISLYMIYAVIRESSLQCEHNYVQLAASSLTTGEFSCSKPQIYSSSLLCDRSVCQSASEKHSQVNLVNSSKNLSAMIIVQSCYLLGP